MTLSETLKIATLKHLNYSKGDIDYEKNTFISSFDTTALHSCLCDTASTKTVSTKTSSQTGKKVQGE